MRVILFVIVALVFSNVAHAYTAVLKSGKKIVGDLLSEDQMTIRLKSHDGVVLSLKKSNLDLQAMELQNVKSDSQSSADSVVKPKTRKKTAAELEEAERKKNGVTKIFTNDDLKDLPEVSVFGTVEQPQTNQASKQQNTSANQEQNTVTLNEAYWRSESERLHYNVSILKDQMGDLERDCRASGGRGSYEYSSESVSKRIPNRNCEKADEAKARLRSEEDKLSDFLERARKSGVPYSWVER